MRVSPWSKTPPSIDCESQIRLVVVTKDRWSSPSPPTLTPPPHPLPPPLLPSPRRRRQQQALCTAQGFFFNTFYTFNILLPIKNKLSVVITLTSVNSHTRCVSYKRNASSRASGRTRNTTGESFVLRSTCCLGRSCVEEPAQYQ